MAETTTTDANASIDALNAQKASDLASLASQLEQKRRKLIAEARGQAISRGLSGSSWETRAAQEVDATINAAMEEGANSINARYETLIFNSEEQRRQNEYNALETEKQNAWQAGENEKARQAEERQAQIERESAEDVARKEAKSALIGNAAQLGTLAYLTKGAGAPVAEGLVKGAAGGVVTPGGVGMLSSSLNKVGSSIFNNPSTYSPAGSGPVTSTFTGGLWTPYARGVSPGGAGATGQAVGSAAGVFGGSYLGQKVARSIFDDYATDKSTSRGAKVGSLAGSTIGTYFGGPKVGMLAGAVGGAYGANVGSNLSRISSLGAGASDNKGLTLGNLGKGIVKNPGKSLESIFSAATGAGAVTKAVKKIFCFLPNTAIEMRGDRSVPIGLLKLGDMTLGGEVYSIRRALVDDLYQYGEIFVTGKHAVKEGERWIRIEDSKMAIPVPGQFEVVSICTTGHRIYSHGITMADEVETNDYEDLSIGESLEALNLQEEARHGS
jgi:hypothetical protein